MVGGDEVVGGLVELRSRVTSSQESSLSRGLRRLVETQSMSNGETLNRELALTDQLRHIIDVKQKLQFSDIFLYII